MGLFMEADTDRSGTLSWDEFLEFVGDEKIMAYFMALDLDMSSAGKIFHLLDKEKIGELELETFVDGCIKLRGSAKMVDIATVQAQNTKLMEVVDELGRRLDNDLRTL